MIPKIRRSAMLSRTATRRRTRDQAKLLDEVEASKYGTSITYSQSANDGLRNVRVGEASIGSHDLPLNDWP